LPRDNVRFVPDRNVLLTEKVFLPWWKAHCTVKPDHPDDAHRPLDPTHNLDASLSIVEHRKIHGADYTFRFLNH